MYRAKAVDGAVCVVQDGLDDTDWTARFVRASDGIFFGFAWETDEHIGGIADAVSFGEAVAEAARMLGEAK